MLASIKTLAPAILLLLIGAGVMRSFAFAATSSTGSTLAYDEDLLLSVEQSVPIMAFNITALQQCGDNGSGPFYSVVGLSNTDYWYEAGLAWNWPSSFRPVTPSAGFQAIFDVFGTGSSSSLFRAVNRMPSVGDGDQVLVRLSFSNNDVVMYVHDWNSSATSRQSYSAFGATEFVGNSNSPVDSNGFYTGLATRQYYNSAYFGDEQRVSYTSSTLIFSSWMRIVEYPYPNKSPVEFDSYGSYTYANPYSLQNFTSNGAFVASDGFQFVTGNLSTGPTCTIQGAPSLLGSLPPYWYLIPIALIGVLVSVLLYWLRRRSTESWFPSPAPQEPYPSRNVKIVAK